MLHQLNANAVNYSTPLSQFLNLHQTLTSANAATNQQSTTPLSITTTGTTNDTSSNLSPSNSSLYNDENNSISYLDRRYEQNFVNATSNTKDNNNTSSSINNNKSFTIAAILGLHKTSTIDNGTLLAPTDAIDHHRKILLNELDNNKRNSSEFSEVMNLSIQTKNNKNSGLTSSAVHISTHPVAASSLFTSHQLHTGNLSVLNCNSASSVTNNKQSVAIVQQEQFNTGSGPTQSSSGSLTHQQRSTDRNTSKHHVTNINGNNLQNKKLSKSKRVRTIFTPEQLERLEAEFERQQYMVGPERLYLAHTLQLTEAQVKVWFQNRRIKWRKHHLEITHQRLAVIKQQQQQLQHQLLHEQETTMDSSASSDRADDT